MSDNGKFTEQGLADLLELFEKDITVPDINSSCLLGKISASIVRKRLELHMTQREFADYMHVSQSMVSKWEGGDYNFSIKTLAEVAENLGMELTVNLSTGKNSQIQYSRNDNITVAMCGEENLVGKN